MIAILLTSLVFSNPQPLPSMPPPLRRWGADAHRVVARIAAARLSPAATREVTRLLDGKSLADVAAWADAIRDTRRATAPWHYVNIPVIDSTWQPRRHCPRSCIVSALDSLIPALTDQKAAKAKRADALRFVVHLIGDLHQPLHAGDRGDRGGNDVRIRFEGRLMTLHAFWDSHLLRAVSPDERALVDRLVAQAERRPDLDRIRQGTIAAWAMESHDVARARIYAVLPQDLIITRSHVNEVAALVHEQLFRAGIRLAAVLERALVP